MRFPLKVDFVADTLIRCHVYSMGDSDIELPDEVAQKMIKSGRAVPAGVRELPRVERAEAVPHAETAEAPPNRKPRRV